MIVFFYINIFNYKTYRNNIYLGAGVVQTPELISVIKLTDYTYLIGFTDEDNSYYPKIFVAKIYPFSEFQQIIAGFTGVVQSSGKKGSVVPFAMPGDMSIVHSGLVPGKKYYYDFSTGQLTLTQTSDRLNLLVGIAKTDKKLFVVGQFSGKSVSRQALEVGSSTVNYFTFENGIYTKKE